MMFEHTLGLALGKTIGEIRSMPAVEFMRWQLYYQVEPFGWQSDEYRTAVILAMLYNINRGKRQRAKYAEDFMRDYQNEIVKVADQEAEQDKLDAMNEDERKAYVVQQIKRDFGVK